MPTGANSEVLPVSRGTKARLAAVKGSYTYDELLAEALRIAPPDTVRARLDARREAQIALVRQRSARPPDGTAEPRRTPAKQLLIARLAERRWTLWLRDGKVVQLGPRRFAYKVSTPEEPSRATIVPRPGRGLPPVEGASLEG